MQKRLLLLAGLGLWILSAAATADDKDLLVGSGSAPPNVMVILSNADTMQYMPYVQGTVGNEPPDGQYQDSPVSKFGLAKAALRAIVQQNSNNFNFGISWYAYHQESVSKKHWSYRSAASDFPGDTFNSAAGTYYEFGTDGRGPILTAGTTATAGTFGIAGTTLAGVWLGNVPAGASCTATSCTGYAMENINSSKRVAVHLLPVGGGQPYGELSITMVKEYQTKSGNIWTTQATTQAGNPGTVSLTLSAAVSTIPSFPNTYTTGTDNGKYMGFMRVDGDRSLNSDCAGWFVQNDLPAVGIPRDYYSDLACTATTCAQPPEQSVGCVLRYTRPNSSVIHFDPATHLYSPSNPPDDPPGLCSSTVVHTGAGPEDQVILLADHFSHIPESNMFKTADDYFSSMDCFRNGVRGDDPNKACRTGAIILLSDTFDACGPNCGQNATAKYLVSLKKHHINVYVIALGVPVGSPQDTESHCIALTSGSETESRQGVFYVTSTDPAQVARDLSIAFDSILNLINESSQTFATTAVSTTQVLGDQMAFFGSFNPTKSRSIWNGRLNGYKLSASGQLQIDQFTIRDPNDPHVNATIPVPSSASTITNPSNPSLIWNAGENLHATPGTGATVSGAILNPGVSTISTGSYNDTSNDTVRQVPTYYYPGRKIVFSLPQGTNPNPSTLPIPAASQVPENRYDMTFTTGATWWPTLKALLGPQTAPPAVLSPALTDTDAGNSLRFIWGDRDAVTGTTEESKLYIGQKLGDVLHSGPLLVGGPNDFALFVTNTHNYQGFFDTYKNRRRVIYVGANDGLLHAFDAGNWDRTPSVCPSAHCYDLGTGAELFAFAPRSIMQIYKPLKDAVGPQTKQDEWTVDLSPSAADMFMDTGHSGTPVPANRAWHTVLVGGVREGSPFEGTDGASPRHSQGSYFALDVTQPDELVGSPSVEANGTFAAPKCLNQAGDGTCARDWPAVLWEITDTDDADGNALPDMGETWSKAAMGRVKVCTANCGASNAVNEDHYVAIFGGGFDRERSNSTCTPACNRRGNWLYMVDVETGFALYKVNSGTDGSGNTKFFGSIPSGPAALDYDGDGYLDVIYVGDLKGQLWRVDLTNLQRLASPPAGRFVTKLDLASGSGKPFLFFQAPQPTPPATAPFYASYNRPEAINLGYSVGGKPALGIAFGTGDRDDITAKFDASSLTYPQRYYYVVDKANTTTRTESDLMPIARPDSPNADTTSTNLPNGWFLELCTPVNSSTCANGERVVGDTLTVGGIIRFPTYNPSPTVTPSSACGGNVVKCGNLASGVSRLYQVFYDTGNPYPTGPDRGVTQENATFITALTGYIAGEGGAFGLGWGGGVINQDLAVGRKVTVRSWKEKATTPP